MRTNGEAASPCCESVWDFMTIIVDSACILGIIESTAFPVLTGIRGEAQWLTRLGRLL